MSSSARQLVSHPWTNTYAYVHTRNAPQQVRWNEHPDRREGPSEVDIVFQCVTMPSHGPAVDPVPVCCSAVHIPLSYASIEAKPRSSEGVVSNLERGMVQVNSRLDVEGILQNPQCGVMARMRQPFGLARAGDRFARGIDIVRGAMERSSRQQQQCDAGVWPKNKHAPPSVPELTSQPRSFVVPDGVSWFSDQPLEPRRPLGPPQPQCTLRYKPIIRPQVSRALCAIRTLSFVCCRERCRFV